MGDAARKEGFLCGLSGNEVYDKALKEKLIASIPDTISSMLPGQLFGRAH